MVDDTFAHLSRRRIGHILGEDGTGRQSARDIVGGIDRVAEAGIRRATSRWENFGRRWPWRCGFAAMDWLLRVLIARLIGRGNLRLTTARGKTLTFGDGTGPLVAARFITLAAQFGVLLEPELKLGEAYMDGTFVMEQGSIADLLDLVMAGTPTHALRWSHPTEALRRVWRRLKQLNWRGRARLDLAHHNHLEERL